MNTDQIPYTVTKAGLEMLARQLSLGIVDLGITINAVDPGPTRCCSCHCLTVTELDHWRRDSC